MFEIVSGWDGGNQIHCLLMRLVAYLIPVCHLSSRSTTGVRKHGASGGPLCVAVFVPERNEIQRGIRSS